MTSHQMTADLIVGTLVRMTAEQAHVSPAFRAALSDSPALRRAEEAMQARAASVEVRTRRFKATKLGAEVILNDLQAGLPFTFQRALAAPFHSEARRQVKLAQRWRNRFGTFATPPTKRTAAARKAWDRMGGAL